MTVAIDSIQSNEQTLGRLRNIPDKQMQFYYLYCGNIESHIKYHNNRKNYIKPLAKEWNEYSYHDILKTR